MIPKNTDPHLGWRGTHTLFPFDGDRLFVLTHLEWARAPGQGKATQNRTNARYFDNSMVRYDKCIRGRMLTDEQVRQVNYIIKSRAYRYIAGATDDDLFPERHIKTRMWNKLGQFLQPDRELYGFGGELFVKHNDGTFYFQDEFGRRPKSKKSTAKKCKRRKKWKRI